MLRRRRPALAVAAVLSVVSAGAGLAPYVAVYLVAVELFGGASPTPGHVAHVAAYAALADLRRALVGRFDRILLSRVTGRSAGELKKTLHDDVEQLEEALAHGVPDVAAAAAVPVATTALLLAVDRRLGLLALPALLVVLVIGGVASAMARASSHEQAASLAEMNVAVLLPLRGMKVVRTFRRAGGADEQLIGTLDRAVRAGDAPLRSPARWLVAMMTATFGLPVALLVPAAGLGVAGGGVDVATLTLFLLLGLGYATPLLAFVGTLATLGHRVQTASTGVAALLAEPDLPAPARPRIPRPGPDELGRIVSVVAQDDHVFDASVRENIRIGRPDASDAEVLDAENQADLTTFCHRLRSWYRRHPVLLRIVASTPIDDVRAAAMRNMDVLAGFLLGTGLTPADAARACDLIIGTVSGFAELEEWEARAGAADPQHAPAAASDVDDRFADRVEMLLLRVRSRLP